MKKLRILFPLIFMALRGYAQEAPKYSYEDLKPTEKHQKVESFVTKFLSNYHYKKFQLDDSLSSKVFDNLMKSVDGGHSYFTESEVKGFEKYRYSLDEALLSGNLDMPYEVFNSYRKLYKKRYDYLMNFLDRPLDFTTDETYDVNRDELEYAKDEKELDARWNKIILSQALSMKLSGSTDSAIVSSLKKRYERYENRVAKWRSEDIFQTYMNAFTRVIDPHTAYMIPSRADQFNIDMSQSLEGIGARLQNSDDRVMIVDVIPGGPLFKTQEANKDDYILAVAQGDDGDFQDIIGWLTDDAVKIIRGKKGTVIRLKLKAKDAPVASQPRIVRMVREKIKLEEAVAAGEVVDISEGDLNYKVGIIDIPMFYRDFDGARKGVDFQSTTRDVKKFLEDFKAKGVDGIMIDLRNNGGGSLTEAIDLTGLFIPEGPVVQRKTGRGKIDVENDKDASVTYDGPLVILQNRFSASASEIFAGAIQDYNRGIIVGEQSFGKGTVQQLVGLDRFMSAPKVASRNGAGSSSVEGKPRFGQLKLTTEKFYRITGNSTQRKGVIPDISFPTPWIAEESGESNRTSALPYDEIRSSHFEDQKVISNEKRTFLNNQYLNRTANSEELQTLRDEIAIFKAQKDISEFSLNYEVRLKEKEENDENRTAIKKLRKTQIGDKEEKRADDLYLNEAKKILTELIKA